jgi:hypothetical protein
MLNSDNDKNDNSNLELDRLKQILNKKIKEKKNQLHPLHAKAYNDNLQIEIRSLRWVLKQLISKRQINRVRGLVESEVNSLGRKMKNAIDMEERDSLITEVEILLWVLYVIQSIEEEEQCEVCEICGEYKFKDELEYGIIEYGK